MRFLRFRSWLRETLSITEMGLAGRSKEGGRGVVAYEQAHHRGGHATSLCVGLVTVLLEEAASQGIETSPVHTATLKKHATGKGNAGKPEMQAAALKRWGKPAGGELQEDQADALCVLGWALDEIGEREEVQSHATSARCTACGGRGKVAIDCGGSLGYERCKACAA